MVGKNRSVVSCFSLEIVVGFALVFAIWTSQGYTNPSDGESENQCFSAFRNAFVCVRMLDWGN